MCLFVQVRTFVCEWVRACVCVHACVCACMCGCMLIFKFHDHFCMKTTEVHTLYVHVYTYISVPVASKFMAL